MESETNEHCPNLPLPRYPGESAKAYLAFVTFYCMKDRTYQKVADAVNVSLVTIKRWASDNKWSDRLLEQKARILGQRVAAEDAIVKIETAKLEEESKTRLNFTESSLPTKNNFFNTGGFWWVLVGFRGFWWVPVAPQGKTLPIQNPENRTTHRVSVRLSWGN